MKDGQLQKWALLAEIFGGLAVVLSLVFVGLEVRQNSRALEVSAYQELIGQINDFHLAAVTDKESSDLADRILRNEISTEEPLGQRVVSFLQYTTRLADMAFLQFEMGLITEEQLSSVLAPLRMVLRTDVGRKNWRGNSNQRTDFVSYIENQMARNYPEDPLWKN